MPQMMPYMWTLIFLSTLISLIFLINFLYFFYIPQFISYNLNKKFFSNKWLWKW